jgi:hypothetical protein
LESSAAISAASVFGADALKLGRLGALGAKHADEAAGLLKNAIPGGVADDISDGLGRLGHAAPNPGAFTPPVPHIPGAGRSLDDLAGASAKRADDVKINTGAAEPVAVKPELPSGGGCFVSGTTCLCRHQERGRTLFKCHSQTCSTRKNPANSA